MVIRCLAIASACSLCWQLATSRQSDFSLRRRPRKVMKFERLHPAKGDPIWFPRMSTPFSCAGSAGATKVEGYFGQRKLITTWVKNTGLELFHHIKSSSSYLIVKRKTDCQVSSPSSYPVVSLQILGMPAFCQMPLENFRISKEC